MWYFTPYYAILRAVPDQKLGALLMALSVAAFLFPAVARPREEQVDALSRPGVEDPARTIFVTFLVLMYLGLKPAEGIYVLLARIFTVLYFAFFILMPIVYKADGNGPVPDRVTLPCALAITRRARAVGRGRCGGSPKNGRRMPSWAARWADNEIGERATSLQRGARNFMGYCSGCHSLKYMRYSRLAKDLKISDAARHLLVPPGDKSADYIQDACPPLTRRNGSARRRRICR